MENIIAEAEKLAGIAKHGWTLDTLHEHLIMLITANDRRYMEMLRHVEETFKASATASDERIIRHLDEVDRRYIALFSSQKESVAIAMTASERAILKAEASAEKRFESVNEFRNTLADQQRNLIPRSESSVAMDALRSQITAATSANTNKIDALEKHLDNLQAERMGIKGGWGYAVGVIGFLFLLASLVVAGTAALRLMAPAPTVQSVPHSAP